MLAAHRDTHFRFLRDLRPGDRITVQGIDGVEHGYRVTGVEIVRWNRFAVRHGAAVRELALSTCYPFDALRQGPLRYVVHASAHRS